MGYNIKYDSAREYRFLPKRRKKVPKWLIVAMILAVLLSIFGNNLKEIILPGDPNVTSAALLALTDDLKDGKDFADAFQAFCTTIIDNADIS